MAMYTAAVPLLLAFLAAAGDMFLAGASPVDDTDVETFTVGTYTRGACEIQGIYPRDSNSFDLSDITRRYSVGEEWSDRCSNCTCMPVGGVCRGPKRDSCPFPYDFTQEHWCIQWSEDGCCCEQMGCMIDGRTYALGEHYPYGEGSPCLTCPCKVGGTREQCLMEQCNTVALHCENRTAQYEVGGCCPVYVCPYGVQCDTIPDPFPATPNHELLDWYGGHLNPIQQGMTQHFHLDSWSSYVCSCQRGGTADCEMRTYGMP